MATTLAQILERKRQEAQRGQTAALGGFASGQQAAQQTAARLTEAKRIRESQAFNPLNALVAGTAGLVTSGGNPFAAGLAALSSSRGKKARPLEAAGAGIAQGIGVSRLGAGADVGKTIGAVSDIKNLNKTLPILRQAGVPSRFIKPLESFVNVQETKQKAEDVLKRKAEETKQKVKSERELAILKESERRKTGLAVTEAKAKTEAIKSKARRSREKKDIEEKDVRQARKEGLARYDKYAEGFKESGLTKSQVVEDYVQLKVFGKIPKTETVEEKTFFGLGKKDVEKRIPGEFVKQRGVTLDNKLKETVNVKGREVPRKKDGKILVRRTNGRIGYIEEENILESDERL